MSSQTKLPTQLMDKIEAKPHKRKNMGEKRKRVRSEGVTLRNRVGVVFETVNNVSL